MAFVQNLFSRMPIGSPMMKPVMLILSLIGGNYPSGVYFCTIVGHHFTVHVVLSGR